MFPEFPWLVYVRAGFSGTGRGVLNMSVCGGARRRWVSQGVKRADFPLAQGDQHARAVAFGQGRGEAFFVQFGKFLAQPAHFRLHSGDGGIG